MEARQDDVVLSASGPLALSHFLPDPFHAMLAGISDVMSDDASTPLHKPRQRVDFTMTSWTAVAAASQPDSPEAHAALERLCNVYWYPLYAYVRRRGHPPNEAEDLTQEFFYRLLRDNVLKTADRERGRFRSFLLGSLTHFLSNQRVRAQAAKRGGKHVIVSMEETQAEHRFLKDTLSDASAENAFLHGWASTLLDQVREAMRGEYEAANKMALFEALESFLQEASSSGDYPTIARKLGMSPGAVAVAVHRLRQRYGELCRQAVAQTLANPTAAEIDEELRQLMDAAGKA